MYSEMILLRRIFILLAVSVFSAGLVAQSGYDMSRLKREKLGRGLVAVRESPGRVAVTWRYLSTDLPGESFDVYRDGKKINRRPLKNSTFFLDDYKGSGSVTYSVRGRKSGSVWKYRLPENAPVGYINIPLRTPAPQKDPFGNEYRYEANDASVGDVDGDGEYEIILKWNPTNARDNSHDGFSGNCYVDCYTLAGEFRWRIDLGINIRSGAHYTQFIVYDLDGDGCAEIVMRTADGTIDGLGNMIGARKADWRSIRGRIIAGPEFLTVFSGRDGRALATVPYIPQRGDMDAWGDRYANRCDRFLACLGYFDGVHPSVVMCRGYYTRSVLAAFDWDGKELSSRWVFDSDTPGNGAYAGQGNHNLRVADVDGDGCDEIIYGQMAVDHDGSGLYSTGMYHGDAMHLVPDVEGSHYYIWGCHENKIDGTTLRDAATGKVVLRYPSDMDIGRCMAADVDPLYKGIELWSPNTGGLRAFDGTLISSCKGSGDGLHAGIPANMAVWWTGDLLREILDEVTVSKYNWETGVLDKVVTFEGCAWNNGSKRNPCLAADIVGDWREEVLVRTIDGSALRLYVSGIPTQYRFHTFMEDPVYRISVATQNVGYNQPAEPGFYFGPDLRGEFRGTILKAHGN